ncbi:hypothetical protein [Haliea sp. E17]|uniref:hypothetical protein n=1 Tax=Haliea sp. E17 TaxID=3401576 RepID=UPI003AAA64A1
MQLDTIVQRIEAAFGSVAPVPANPLSPGDIETLTRVFGDEAYQLFLQDQVSCQIIRDYLTNALVLGFIAEKDLLSLDDLVATPQSRAAISLHMLMTSVEDAAELLAQGKPDELVPLEIDPDTPPHIHLVRN